jgi:hypothetical protein
MLIGVRFSEELDYGEGFPKHNLAILLIFPSMIF